MLLRSPDFGPINPKPKETQKTGSPKKTAGTIEHHPAGITGKKKRETTEAILHGGVGLDGHRIGGRSALYPRLPLKYDRQIDQAQICGKTLTENRFFGVRVE